MGIRYHITGQRHWVVARSRASATVDATGKPYIFKFSGAWWVMPCGNTTYDYAAFKFAMALKTRDKQNTP